MSELNAAQRRYLRPVTGGPQKDLPLGRLVVKDPYAARDVRIEWASDYLTVLFEENGPFAVLAVLRVPALVDSVRCCYVSTRKAPFPESIGGHGYPACMQMTEFVVVGSDEPDPLILIPACRAHVGYALAMADDYIAPFEPEGFTGG